MEFSEDNLFSAVQPLIEPGVAEADSNVFWAQRKFTPPNVNDGVSFYSTLQVISGPSELGMDQWEVTGTKPDEKATTSGDRVLTLQVKFIGEPAQAKASNLQSRMVLPVSTDSLQAFDFAFERSAGIVDGSLQEDNVWVQIRILDLILRTVESVEEDVDIIETAEFVPSLTS